MRMPTFARVEQVIQISPKAYKKLTSQEVDNVTFYQFAPRMKHSLSAMTFAAAYLFWPVSPATDPIQTTRAPSQSAGPP